MSAIRSGCTAPAAASSPWWCWLSSALSFTRSGIRPWKSPNGTRAKTVLTESTGRVGIDVPRDRDGTFEPQIVRKRQRRLTGVDQMVLSLYAKGLTTGEISAHFAEIYGASVSKETISRITDKVIDEMTDWCNRPLDGVYAAIFIDAVVRHEALCDRVEVGDLHRLAVAAAR